MRLDNVGVIIPAAGQGTRMGAGVNKQFLTLMGVPILVHTLKVFQESEFVQEIVVVGAGQDIPLIWDLVKQYRFSKVTETPSGGEQRQESVFAGLKALNPAIQTVVVHDGARPLLTLSELNRFLAEAEGSSGAIMAVEVKDTIKKINAGGWVLETFPRRELRAVQTPQVFPRRILQEAHAKAEAAGFVATDDAALLEWLNQPIRVLHGSLENIKITTPEDLLLAERILEKRYPETIVTNTRTTNPEPRTPISRVGMGYDVHALVEGRLLILGGVEVPFDRGLLGHSDADVLLHAIMDALLGALALGDIGAHFPDTEEKYRGISSLTLLANVVALVKAKGYRVGNLDSILIAQRPKLAPHIPAMRENIARTLGVESECVSVKATTTERLGFVGREEGISAQAVVNIWKSSERSIEKGLERSI